MECGWCRVRISCWISGFRVGFPDFISGFRVSEFLISEHESLCRPGSFIFNRYGVHGCDSAIMNALFTHYFCSIQTVLIKLKVDLICFHTEVYKRKNKTKCNN